MNKISLSAIVSFMATIFFMAVSCSKPSAETPTDNNNGDDGPDIETKISITLSEVETAENFVVFNVDIKDATEAAWLMLSSESKDMKPSTVLSKGVKLTEMECDVRCNGLQPDTKYYFYVAASNESISALDCIDLTTLPYVPEPTASLTEGTVTSSSLSFSVTYENADECRYFIAESPEGITAESVLENGTAINESGVTIEAGNLAADTMYYVFVAVKNAKASKLMAPLNLRTLPGLVTFTSSGVKYNNDTNWTITFTSDEAYMEVDFYSASVSMLSEGEYTLGSTGTFEFDKKYSYFCKDKSNMESSGRDYFSSGTAKVSLDSDKKYEIEFNLVTEGGSTLKAEYHGDIADIDFSEPATFVELNGSQARRVDVNNALPGEFYIRMNDAKWSFEAILDFYADPADSELPAGVYYVASVAGAKGTVGPKTEFSDYNANETYKFVSGRVVVTKVDGKYTFDYSLTTSSDFLVKGKFNGEVANMNLAE
ncbi:MAG: hypothetical protein ACI4TM_02615 [Candidatus Cryptobacteroides sp.]